MTNNPLDDDEYILSPFVVIATLTILPLFSLLNILKYNHYNINYILTCVLQQGFHYQE